MHDTAPRRNDRPGGNDGPGESPGNDGAGPSGQTPPAQGPPAQGPSVQGALDAVDQMVVIVDGLEGYILHTDTVKRHGINYRLNLLWVHAFAALCMAPLLAATGRTGLAGPSFAFLRTLPGAPYSLALILGSGGLILGMGCVFRAKRTEITGLLCLGVFYLLFGASFTVVPVRWLLDPQAVKPPLYAPIVYAHLAVIMLLHIRGLITVLRDDVRRRLEDFAA